MKTEGFVPATYIEVQDTATSTLPPLHSAPLPSTSVSNRPSSVYSAGSSNSLANSVGNGVGNSNAGKKKGPAVAPKRGAKKLRYVEAIYQYTSRSESEHSMTEGERFVLVKADSGDGWVDVERGGKVASVPSSYVKDLA